LTNLGPKLQEVLETTGLNKVFSLDSEASGQVAWCGSRRLSIREIQAPDGNLFAPKTAISHTKQKEAQNEKGGHFY